MRKIIKMNQGKNKMLTLRFTSDSGHGWLACKISLLKELNVYDKITCCSYFKGATAYLEEDMDMGFLIKALEAENYSFKIIDGARPDRSPIRNYEHFKQDLSKLGYIKA